MSGMVSALFIVVSLFPLFAVADGTTDADASIITTFTAHPAMFGKRWNTVVTANVTLVTVDLCSEWKSSNIFDTSSDGQISGNFSENHGIVLYHDPTEQTGKAECKYASMAQVAQRMYPKAQFLLFPSDHLEALSSPPDVPNPNNNLSVAVVTFQHGKEIRRAISDLNGTSDGYTIQIDAVSRSIFDVDWFDVDWCVSWRDHGSMESWISYGFRYFDAVRVLGFDTCCYINFEL